MNAPVREKKTGGRGEEKEENYNLVENRVSYFTPSKHSIKLDYLKARNRTLDQAGDFLLYIYMEPMLPERVYDL